MPHNKTFEEQALLYAYGELDNSKEKAFLEHLKTCKECQTVIKMTTLLSVALPPKQAPVFNWQEEPKAVWSFKNLFNKINLSRPVLWGTAAACCVAVLVGIFGLKQPSSDGYMYFSDSIYAQIGDIETDIDTLLEDINNL